MKSIIRNTSLLGSAALFAGGMVFGIWFAVAECTGAGGSKELRGRLKFQAERG
jgi:hypothetical protein